MENEPLPMMLEGMSQADEPNVEITVSRLEDVIEKLLARYRNQLRTQGKIKLTDIY